MTAYGRTEDSSDVGHVIWEVRTINHRYLEINLRLPEELRSLDQAIRDLIGKHLQRGKVDCNLRFETATSAEQNLTLDEELLQQVIGATEILKEKIQEHESLNLLDMLRWPGVIKQNPLNLDEIKEQLLRLLDKTLQSVVDTRAREGNKIYEMIESRCVAILEQLEKLKVVLPEIQTQHRNKLLKRAEELSAEIDSERLEQEMVMLAQKMDVAEELDRLEAHVSEVRHTLKKKGSVGRRLDFLMQELNREANTLGSKSNHMDMTNTSVELKVLIEQMREQIQNIE